MTTRSYWRLNKNITCCVSAGRVLFLDALHDRYFALPAGKDTCFIAWLSGLAATADIQHLLNPLGVEADDTTVSITPVERPVAMPIPIDPEALPLLPFSATAAAGVSLAVVLARRRLRNKPLHEVLARALARPRQSPSPSAAERDRRLASFRRMRPFVPVPRVCLHDCLALLDWLGAHRDGIALVLGVSASPFTAHSWLQLGDRSIDDHPTSPSRFQPILHLQ